MAAPNNDNPDQPTAIADAREALSQFARHGGSYSPASVVFSLASLDEHGSSTGDGAHVCPDCVSTVATQALACLDGVPLPWDPQRGTWKIVDLFGRAATYDLVGATALEYDTFCAECRLPIVGNHIPSCNGRSYVAGIGDRAGRACFCSDIDRLHHVRPGDGAAGELEDRRGDRYLERRAGALTECDVCEGPIHRGELYFALVASTWVRCRRCTIAY
jgi:hypothetical protein